MIDTKKLSVCFLVCVFATSTLAAPAVKPSTTTGNEINLFATDLSESIKHFTSEMEGSFKNFTHHVEHMFQSLDKIVRNSIEGGFVNVATWAFDIIGRFEFLVMADGSHFLTPLSGKPELEEEYRTIALAVSKLLRNLKTMERADELITNVTRKVVSEDLEHHIAEMKSSEEKLFKTMLNLYMEALDKQFTADKMLATDYTRQKTVAKEHVKRDPKMQGPLIKLWEVNHKDVGGKEMNEYLQDKEVVRQVFVSKLFLKYSVKHLTMIFNTTHQHRYYEARAMIQVAQSSAYDSKVNEMYHKALKRAAAVQHMHEGDDVIADVLFEAIEQDLVTDKHLYKEIEKRMKQIKVDTSYDLSMFYVDFSPL